MAQTKEGAKKMTETFKRKYGEDWYSKIGAMGGKVKSQSKGFGSMDRQKHREASAKGGTISRRNRGK